MSEHKKSLFIPSCTYCGSECTPLGPKKLKQMQNAGKKIYCSLSCEEKDKYYTQIKGMWPSPLAKEDVDILEEYSRIYVDLTHTADKAALQQRMVIVFDDSRYSFICGDAFKKALSTALEEYAHTIRRRITND